ncbi:MAG TPA: hypothetical protein VLU38_06710 [Methanomassiliicoccales archaeon]|nr:hypothetical protein [Methanomassiliicoccales archaeon]
MKVIQVKCPNCDAPIISRQRDLLFHCERCGTLHVRDGGVNVLDYEIADFAKGAPVQSRTYVPFWRMYASFTIHHMDSTGGSMYKLASWIKGGKGDSGDVFVFVPAPDFDPATFKYLATYFTANWPKYDTRLDFGGVPRAPAYLDKEEAMKLANFVIITLEAEKPGVLQQLDYDLDIRDARIVYLPFNSTSSGLVPAL